jgi:hypothetical protein
MEDTSDLFVEETNNASTKPTSRFLFKRSNQSLDTPLPTEKKRKIDKPIQPVFGSSFVSPGGFDTVAQTNSQLGIQLNTSINTPTNTQTNTQTNTPTNTQDIPSLDNNDEPETKIDRGQITKFLDRLYQQCDAIFNHANTTVWLTDTLDLFKNEIDSANFNHVFSVMRNDGFLIGFINRPGYNPHYRCKTSHLNETYSDTYNAQYCKRIVIDFTEKIQN